jgi:hypothetical protein
LLRRRRAHLRLQHRHLLAGGGVDDEVDVRQQVAVGLRVAAVGQQRQQRLVRVFGGRCAG